MAQEELRAHASLSYFDGLFNLVYAENPGMMLGIGSALPQDLRFVLFVLVVGGLLAAAVLFVLLKPLRAEAVFALSLIVGGGFSNLLDRLIRDGSVIDFMVIRVGALESGIFNVADVAIVAGCGMLLLSLYRARTKRT